MRVQDVTKQILKESGITQQQLAERFGKASQGTISMLLNGRTMKVENLLLILDECGYEMVLRSRDEGRPEYVINNEQSQRIPVKSTDDDRIREIVEDVVAKKIREYRKLDRKVARMKELEARPNDIQAGKVLLPDLDNETEVDE